MSRLPMTLSVPDRGRSYVARDCRKGAQNPTFVSAHVTTVAFGEAKISPQAMICKKLSASGFPLRIHRSITTSHVILIMRGRQLGLPKVARTRDGRHRGRSYGFMGNVCSPLSIYRMLLMTSGSIAGSGKSVLWYVALQQVPSEITQTIFQLFSYPRP